MKSIPAKELHFSLKNNNGFLLDVRTPEEYQASHIEGAILIPLDIIEKRIEEIPKDRPVYVYCRSGNRSRLAINRLQPYGFDNLVNVDGGLMTYQKNHCKQSYFQIPIMQQVQIIAGLIIIVSVIFSWLIHPWFTILTCLVGGGLIFAGITGVCTMEKFLYRMPWNQPQKSQWEG